jgi:hypothetical protein
MMQEEWSYRERQTSYTLAIFVVNFLQGLSFNGWVVALVWSVAR